MNVLIKLSLTALDIVGLFFFSWLVSKSLVPEWWSIPLALVAMSGFFLCAFNAGWIWVFKEDSDKLATWIYERVAR